MTVPAPAPATPGRMVARALRLHCPVCGSGGIFPRWFHMVDRCPRCDLRFERHEGQWVGSLGMNTIVSFGVLLLVMVVGMLLTYPDIPMWPLTGLSVATALLVPLIAFPWSRTLWMVVDLMMTPVRRDELDPAWAAAAPAPAPTPPGRRPERPGRRPVP